MSWQTAKLGEVADLNPREPARPALDERVSFVPMADLDAEWGMTAPGVDRPFAEVQKGYTIFRDQDVLVAKITPCFENCKIGQARLRRRFGVGSTEFHVVRPHADRLDHRYVLHLLRQQRVLDEGERRMTGSGGQRRVPLAFLSELQIPLPPLAEQRRIAAILDHADALRAKRRQTLALLDDLTQAVFLDMFGDPLANPVGWPMARLGDLGIWQSGGTPPRSSKAYFDGSVPWFSSGELGQLLTRDSREHISESALVETSAKAVAPGSLMLGMYDTAALKASIASTWVSCNQAVAFAQLDTSHANVIYVYFAIQIGKERLKRLQRGIRQKNLNLSLIRSVSIALPPRPAQDKFATVVDHIKIQRETGDFARATEEELRASLRDQLLSSSLGASKCLRKGIDGRQSDCVEAARTGSTSQPPLMGARSPS